MPSNQPGLIVLPLKLVQRQVEFFHGIKKVASCKFFGEVCVYAAACWGNHSCSHCLLSSTTFKMPSALLPVGLQLIPLCF
jgi:hypothetical protein